MPPGSWRTPGAMLQDLLIPVTNFFRDRDVFATLETHICGARRSGIGITCSSLSIPKNCATS